eukprot:CAMPEP_0172882550 /NCGR_PEP_ID=MMETSP1075-20121228/120393_1 /TAXON_ID=2916 /ORGANISM="Ceratium fusus, Strain PA161109" /LENGTH=134 /DNA_ID=CAMNT_0013735237 /DNA_START=227 /DNA_END=626 /DNA_ORIENTATION=-
MANRYQRGQEVRQPLTQGGLLQQDQQLTGRAPLVASSQNLGRPMPPSHPAQVAASAFNFFLIPISSCMSAGNSSWQYFPVAGSHVPVLGPESGSNRFCAAPALAAASGLFGAFPGLRPKMSLARNMEDLGSAGA